MQRRCRSGARAGRRPQGGALARLGESGASCRTRQAGWPRWPRQCRESTSADRVVAVTAGSDRSDRGSALSAWSSHPPTCRSHARLSAADRTPRVGREAIPLLLAHTLERVEPAHQPCSSRSSRGSGVHGRRLLGATELGHEPRIRGIRFGARQATPAQRLDRRRIDDADAVSGVMQGSPPPRCRTCRSPQSTTCTGPSNAWCPTHANRSRWPSRVLAMLFDRHSPSGRSNATSTVPFRDIDAEEKHVLCLRFTAASYGDQPCASKLSPTGRRTFETVRSVRRYTTVHRELLSAPSLKLHMYDQLHRSPIPASRD